MISLSCLNLSSFTYNQPNFSNFPSIKILQQSIIESQRQKEILAKNVSIYYEQNKKETTFRQEPILKPETIFKQEHHHDYDQTPAHNTKGYIKQSEMKFDRVEITISYTQEERVFTDNFDSSLDNYITSTDTSEDYKMSKKTQDASTSGTKDAKFTEQSTQEQSRQVNMFGNIALQQYTDFSKQFHVTDDHMLTKRQQCILDNMWHLQTLPQAASFKIRVLQALSTCFKEQNTEHIQNTQYIQYLQSERILLNQQIQTLKKRNTKLTQQLEEKDTQPKVLQIDHNSFRARMLDLPWTQVMAPVIDRFPDFEDMVSQKVCSQFPIILLELQQKLLNKAYEYSLYPRVEILERTDLDGTGTGLLLLQMKYPAPGISDDDIIQFYHHGMLDYIEFPRNNKADELIKRFGEKVTLTLEKMATRNSFLTISCKIIASLPDASTITYRPSRKRIFIHYNNTYPSYHLKATCTTYGFSATRFPWLQRPPMSHPPGFSPLSPGDEPLSFSDIIQKNQQTPDLPDHMHWDNYKLLAEGHYLQIYSTAYCSSFLPFSGEGDLLELKHIKNLDDMDEDDDPGSPQSIDSTHRDL